MQHPCKYGMFVLEVCMSIDDESDGMSLDALVEDKVQWAKDRSKSIKAASRSVI